MKTTSATLFRRVAAVAALTLGMASAALAGTQTWTFATTPVDGNLSGAAGSRIGWGYSLENQDDTLWLVLSSVSADALQHAQGDAIFDAPILAPGASRQVNFNGTEGLYALTWDLNAPTSFVNSGTFILSAEWWTGDPLAGGSFVGLADDHSANFSATVQGVSAVPEAQTWWLVVAGMGVIALRRRRAT